MKKKNGSVHRKAIWEPKMVLLLHHYTLRGFIWGSIFEAYGSLLNSKEPFMLKRLYNDKKGAFWHKGSL